MNAYGMSAARQRLADLLDAAEAGEAAVIERRGVRFELRSIRGPSTARRHRAWIEMVDPAVADGSWTWEPRPAGLRFRGRRAR